MSAEVTTKRRGRPSKKVVVVEEVLVRGGGGNAPETKIVGKAKKASVSTAASTSSATSTSTGRGITVTVQDVSLASEEEANLSTTSKRKVAAKSSGLTAPNALGEKVAIATRKATKRQAKSPNIEPGPPAPVAGLTTKVEPLAEGQETSIAGPAASKSKTSALAKEGLKPSLQQSKEAIEVRRSEQALSKILRQAKAFSQHSSELQQSTFDLVSRREIVYASVPGQRNTRGFPGSTSQRPIKVDATAFATSSLPDETTTTNTAVTTDSTQNLKLSSTSTPTSPAEIPPDTTLLNPQQTPTSLTNIPPLTMPPISQLKSTFPPQIRAYSSTSPLPMSTTITLSARQATSTGTPTPTIGNSKPSLPPRRQTTIPPEIPREIPHGPRGPKLTELPYDQLVKNPRYKAGRWRYVKGLVAMPFAIMLSYWTWEARTYFLPLERSRFRTVGDMC